MEENLGGRMSKRQTQKPDTRLETFGKSGGAKVMHETTA